VGGHHQGDHDLGLGERGDHVLQIKTDRPILRPWLATVQPSPWPCHSS
jgi:hypothetical protein